MADQTTGYVSPVPVPVTVSSIPLTTNQYVNKSGSGFNISNFRSSAAISNGVMKNSYFYVIITPPKSLRGIFPNLSYFCEASVLPGTVFQSAQLKRYGFGPTTNHPIAPQFNQIPMNFICDAGGNALSAFTKWQQQIIKINPNEPIYKSYTVGYQSDYSSTIYIYALSPTGDVVVFYTLYDAYPIGLGDIELNWADTDRYMKLPVIFQYSTYTNSIVQASSASSSGTDLLGTLTKLGSVAQVVSMMKTPTSIQNLVGDVNHLSNISNSF